tara:strand:- start:144 stop:650 length:507 start_codon:yes stop_codon:yes gene_type:complete
MITFNYPFFLKIFIIILFFFVKVNGEINIGQKIKPFSVKMLKGGKTIYFGEADTNKTIVFVFFSFSNFDSQKMALSLHQVRDSHLDKNISYFLINVGDKENKINQLAEQYIYSIPILLDSYKLVLPIFKCNEVPLTVVFNDKMEVIYYNKNYNENYVMDLITQLRLNK